MRSKKLSVSVIVISLLLIVAMVFTVACSSSTPTTTAPASGAPAKTLKIGYLLCITGWYSVFDAQEEINLKTTAQIINERGGITVQGQKYNIALVGQDGKSALDGVTAAANKLVFDDKVKFVIGPTGFFSTGSSPVFEPNKVLHVSGYVSNQPGELDASTPYGFLGFDASVGTSMGAIKVMKKEFPNVKNVAIGTPDDGAIPYLIPIIKKMLTDQGYNVVGETVAWPNELQDFSPIAAKLNAISTADAYFLENGGPPHHGGILKGLRSLGNNKPIVLQGLASLGDILAIAGKDAASNITGMAITPGAPGNPPIMDEIYQKSGGKGPMYNFNPNGLWILSQVIQAANSLDPAVVKAKWESMTEVDTLFGKGLIGGTQTYGIKNHAVSHPLSYEKVVNGQVQFGGWIDVGAIP